MDSCSLLASSAEKTRFIGASLASTVYTTPLTVLLSGELGAGKTTFLQGFAESLGIGETVTSPTYALEQRYMGTRGALMHIDLYRLSSAQAGALMAGNDTFAGIRVVEWPERVGLEYFRDEPRIMINIEEINPGRKIHLVFDDAPLPPPETIDQWRKEVRLPAHVVAHCDAVTALSMKLADALIKKSRIVRRSALERAAAVHDLFRFLDFRPQAQPDGFVPSPEDLGIWERWKKQFEGLKHEAACAAFLRRQGYETLAQIVEVHGLALPPHDLRTIEQKLLFYADKRVLMDKVVSLEERFDDFARRYGNGQKSDNNRFWFEETKKVERELFPEGEIP